MFFSIAEKLYRALVMRLGWMIESEFCFSIQIVFTNIQKETNIRNSFLHTWINRIKVSFHPYKSFLLLFWCHIKVSFCVCSTLFHGLQRRRTIKKILQYSSIKKMFLGWNPTQTCKGRRFQNNEKKKWKEKREKKKQRKIPGGGAFL